MPLKKSTTLKTEETMEMTTRTTNVVLKNINTKIPVRKNKQSRIEILKLISEQTVLTRKQVESVFDALNKIIGGHLKKQGSGEVIIPKTGIKIRRIKKKASKARDMHSPLTNRLVHIKAKPSRNVIKVTALKCLKNLLEQ